LRELDIMVVVEELPEELPEEFPFGVPQSSTLPLLAQVKGLQE